MSKVVHVGEPLLPRDEESARAEFERVVARDLSRVVKDQMSGRSHRDQGEEAECPKT